MEHTDVKTTEKYSSRRTRQYLRQRGIGVVIPRKGNERHRGRFDRDTYRERNAIERLINRLKQFRRIATRYEKKAANAPFHGDDSRYPLLAVATDVASLLKANLQVAYAIIEGSQWLQQICCFGKGDS